MATPLYNKPPINTTEYELLQHSHELIPPQPSYNAAPDYTDNTYTNQPVPSFNSTSPLARRGFLHTVWKSPATLIALPLGLSGSIACFGFTYWLSLQTFTCPSWSLYCSVPPNVAWMAAHMGQVQGVVSALYGIFLAMIAYVAYALAETTLWPAMTRRSFRMKDIDGFLELSRGSLPAFPKALWHSFRGGFYHVATIMLVGLLAALLFFNSIFIGHAYTLESVPTRYLSNFTQGADIGFAFDQWNPPGSLPGSSGDANAVYTGWANNMTSEPLPALRDFIVDRRNLAKIGNTTINAVKATRNINCSAFELRITQDVSWRSRTGDVNFKVATHIPNTGDPERSDYYELNNDQDEDGYKDVTVRVEPYISVWVDEYHNTSLTSATTRLVFAAMNGTIEGGYHTAPTKNMESLIDQGYYYSYSGIDSLACDVSITLEDAQACIGPCTSSNTTLLSLETLGSPNIGGDRWKSGPRVLWDIAVWLATVPTTFGTSVFGAQPMYGAGPILANSSLSLPTAFSSTSATQEFHWSQSNITNFIDVAAGAFGITLTASFPLNETANATVISTLGTPRLDTSHTWVILIPIFLSVAAVLLLALLSYLSYKAANVHDVRFGRVGDLVVSAQTESIRGMVDRIRSGMVPYGAIDEMQLRYGMVPDGHDGLGGKGEVRPL